MSTGQRLPTRLPLLLVLPCAGLLLAFACPARADDSIQVDTSVLNEAPPGGSYGHLKPVVLKPPTPGDQARPMAGPAAEPGSLTAPDDDGASPAPVSADSSASSWRGSSTPAPLPPPEPDEAGQPTVTPYYPHRQAQRQQDILTPSGHPAVAAQVPLGLSPRPALARAPRRAISSQQEDDKPVAFPVVTKIRSDSPDPSLPESSAVPVSQIEAEHDKKPPVLPVNTDVAAAVAGQLATSVPASVPPAPARKPAYYPAAGGKKAAAATGPTPAPGRKVRIEAVRIAKPSLADVPAVPMPATPKPPAGAPVPKPSGKPVPPPRSGNDHMMDKMMDMDKSSVMAGVEDVVKRTSNLPGRTVPDGFSGPMPRGTSVIGAKRLMPETARGNTIISPADRPSGKIMDTAQPLEPADKVPVGQTLHAPPAEDYRQPSYVSITYEKTQLGLNEGLQAYIKSMVLPILKGDPQIHMQIQAFATDGPGENHNARQRSLARALAVREYLMGQGIKQERLDLRAMGMQSDREPLDRVDFVAMPATPAKGL